MLDEAFKSRIHMSLGYPALDLNSTREIWKMNLERTKDHFGKQLKVRDSEIIRFAERHFEDKTRKREGPWNGMINPITGYSKTPEHGESQITLAQDLLPNAVLIFS